MAKESKWPDSEDQVPKIANKNREIKPTVSINAIKIEGGILSNKIEQISIWKKLLQVVAFVMKFVKRMKKISADGNESNVLTVEDTRSAEVIVLHHYQETGFKEVYIILNGKGDQSKKLKENIGCLNPYLDEKSLISVGGQLRQSGLAEAVKHPILLPKKGHITNLTIRWCHEKTAHSEGDSLKLDPPGIG